MEISLIATACQFVKDYWPHISLSSIAIPVITTIVFTYLRRPKSSASEIGQYFTDEKLLSPPLTRPAYSDRMAYVLAEMSDLAYYQFEGQSSFVADTVQDALSLNLTTDTNLNEFLEKFSVGLMSKRNLSLKFLRRLLENSGFSLLKVINVAETQGFACKRNTPDEPPYVVIAFRGTEKKVSDWLTDAQCVPTLLGKGKVHTGFLEAFTQKKNVDGKTTKDVVNEILRSPDTKDENGNPLPLFITGHSLGGALALLATRLVASNVNGSCYTFGAPRIGNYEYFRFLKTPVYRIVNSSDIVPRVPPGAGMNLLVLIAKAVSWLTGFVPAVSSMFDRIEEFLDKLNGYRHFGDLRYLSDVSEGRFKDVRLLSNPPTIDRIVWMWRHVGKSFLVPVKSHSMKIYRKKLEYIANNRNEARGD